MPYATRLAIKSISFGEQLISRYGKAHWSSRFCDHLSPLDYFCKDRCSLWFKRIRHPQFQRLKVTIQSVASIEIPDKPYLWCLHEIILKTNNHLISTKVNISFSSTYFFWLFFSTWKLNILKKILGNFLLLNKIWIK